jgi:hypothetical protein
MLDWILHAAEMFVRYGLTPTTLIMLSIYSVRLTVRNRRIKRRLRKHLPWLIADDESEVKSYVANQQAIIHNLKRLMERMGMEWNVPTSETSKGSTNAHRTFYISSSVGSSVAQDAAQREIRLSTKSNTRRRKNMKEYLKKLGRTKFQALLASIIINGLSVYLFLSGTLDIDGSINFLMPIINMVALTISTCVYILVEGSIDKANVNKEQSPPPEEDGSDYNH